MNFSTSILVDLDGTLCDPRDRDYLIHEKRDWEAHSLACGDDPAILGNVELVNMLAEFHNIILCSGRGHVAYSETLGWLARNGVKWDLIMLRETGDRTNNATYKLNVVKKLEEAGHKFVLAIDDYHKTARTLTEYGIPTVLVASYTSHGNPEELLALNGVKV